MNSVSSNSEPMDQSWTIVHFLKENSVEAVPTTWIEGNRCYWPAFPSDKVYKAIKNHEHPSSCWESFEIRIFRNATYDTYKEASYKSKVAIDTSDINEPEQSRETRKSRSKKKISSSSEENNNSDVPTPPRKSVKPLTTKFADPGIKRNGNSSAPNSLNPSCTCCQFHMNELQITLKNLITEIHNITKKHNLMMSVITESIDEVKNLSIQLKKINREDIQPDSSMSSNFNFPISSQENFSELEEYLSNEKQFNAAVIEISKMGGTNEYDFIKRSLSWMMKNSLLMQFTWHGTKEKKGLMSTKFGQTILKASEKISVYTNRKNVEDAIKKFLRRSKERNAYENKSEPS